MQVFAIKGVNEESKNDFEIIPSTPDTIHLSNPR